jgi:hypothetical protein
MTAPIRNEVPRNPSPQALAPTRFMVTTAADWSVPNPAIASNSVLWVGLREEFEEEMEE